MDFSDWTTKELRDRRSYLVVRISAQFSRNQHPEPWMQREVVAITKELQRRSPLAKYLD